MDRVKIREARSLAALLFAAAFLLDAGTAIAAVEISAKPTANMTCSGGVCTSTAKKAVFNVTDLATMLASGDVTIKSDASTQDIEIDAAISWTSTQRLTLDAYHAIAFNEPVVVAGTGALTITTNDGGAGGDFQFFKKGHVEFWDLTSNLIINGNQYILLKSIKAFSNILRNTNGAGLYFAQPKSWNISKHHFHNAPLQGEFEGTYEGLGNTISHLNIHDDDIHDNSTALFLGLNTSGVLRDLSLSVVDVQGAGIGVAALSGDSFGLIENCHVAGQVSASRGGGNAVGGLLGFNAGTIKRSSANVTVSGTGILAVGGLVGVNNGADAESGIISDSYSEGSVTGGGIALGVPAVGGLVGQVNGGQITNGYATGTVVSSPSNTSASVGGLIGALSAGSSGNPTIESTYATGNVSGDESAIVGGLIGSDNVQSGTSNSYWNLTTSGVSDPSKGAGNVSNDAGIKGLSDVQLKSELPAGYSKKVWKQNGTLNGGYPYLADNPPPK